jgi:Zn-dependent M32 family carboxypeptidase
MPLQLQYIEDHLGAEGTQAFIEWAVHTAQLRDEITEAVQVINDVFDMAKTAGQVKRMVPELLQYLPFKLRSAYEEQKRASSMPFEWAPYDKSKVERMITTVSKGHLLSNMAKQCQSGYHVNQIGSITWATYATPDA